jgi:hypothetical protein
MHSLDDKVSVAKLNVSRHRGSEFSSSHIAVLAATLTLLISTPIWTHPLPPISDYINHLARMYLIASLPKTPQLAGFYQVDWAVIPNLTMDLVIPVLTRFMNVYLAGQIFLVLMFALIVSGILALNRVLIGRLSALPLFAVPLLYNYVFLVGLMNYIFGIGVALWALAGWIAVRDRDWPIRFALSTICVVALFFCHLSALGIYGIGLLSFESWRLWQQRLTPDRAAMVSFVVSGLPFLAIAPLLYISPTMQLVSATIWDERGKIEGLMYVIEAYSDIATVALIAILVGSMVWAIRHRILHFHPLLWFLLIVGGLVYLALPQTMFDTYMADQRVPVGVAFLLFACGDLQLRRRVVRRACVIILILLTAGRSLEIGLNWSALADTTSEFRSSLRRIERGSKVFVAYADASLGEDVRDFGLVHAASLATIERSALVTTIFTVTGKQVLHVRPEYLDYVDIHDGTPPSIAQLIVAAEHPLPDMPGFWLNWTKFDYLYVLFTEDEAPNPAPSRLKLVADGDRFQLYRISHSQ